MGRLRLGGGLAGLFFFVASSAWGQSAYDFDNSAALAHFRQGRYAAAYAAFWPALQRGDPEAIFHGLIIRRNGLDGREPAQSPEMAALTDFLGSRAEFMRQALAAKKPRLPESTADAYRTALAQLLYAGHIPLSRPPDSPEKFPARRREEALAQISSFWWGAPADRYPPAQNFAAYLIMAGREGAPQKALALLRKSAEAGDCLGLINLSYMHREGAGAMKDDLRAAHLARRAADSEPPLARAQNEVGFFYETGRGVTRDLSEARAWYERSAAQGYPPGRQNAARLHESGSAPREDRPVLAEGLMY